MKIWTKKSRNISFGHIFYYFVAALASVAWIANLGVVPLFLFSAFLALPAFFFFLNLLFSVTHVLETIGKLLYNCLDQLRTNTNKYILFLNLNSKPYFLPINRLCVKGIFALWAFFGLALSSISWADDNSDIIIAKGQSIGLNFPQLDKFNISNKEVIKYKLDEKSKSLLIRGASLGTSELVVWQKGNLPIIRRQIYVISKKDDLTNLSIAQLIQGLGLIANPGVPYIRVTGLIENIDQFKSYKRIQRKYQNQIIDTINVSKKVQNEILAEVYRALLKSFKDTTKCEIEYSNIVCNYPVNQEPDEDLKKILVEKYNVKFIKLENQNIRKNYSFRIKIVQLEQLDGKELRFGLDQLNTNLYELIKLPILNIIEKNKVLLSNNNIHMSTLAEPSGLIRTKSPAEFSIGAEIPYSQQNKDGVQNTSWQFAGLKVKLEIENLGDELILNYETSLTKPDHNDNSSISGNKEKSSIVINTNSPYQMFNILLKTDGTHTSSMPLFSEIPVLGQLFKSKSKKSTYKIITAVIEVQ